MIKYLISCLLIIQIFSCKQIEDDKISTKINNSVQKIEEKISNIKQDNNNIKNIDNNSNETIYYYIGEQYFIEGVKYLPQEDYNYSEIGLATFYGKELHNTKTVNNDINKVTELLGRHKTLPLPSMVKITNLDNGLSLNIKIIDRHNDNSTLVQVSRKVAQLLGFYKDKIATVKIEILSDSSKQWKKVTTSLNEPEFDKTISSAPTEIVSISNIDDNDLKLKSQKIIDLEPIEINYNEVKKYELFLKIYNFDSYNTIKNLINSLDDSFNYTSEKNGSNYDLILGPIDKKQLNNLVSYFISKGYKETEILLN